MDNKKDLSKSIYIGYTPRLIYYIVLVPILSTLAVILLYKAFEVDELLNIRYEEIGNIDVKILDANKQETTDKTKIDTINLNMDYNFNINYESNISFNTKIVRTVYIVNKNNKSNIIYEDSKDLVKATTEEIINDKNYNLKKEITIPYKEYLTQVEKYRSSYSMDTIAYIIVSEEINYNSLNNNNYYLKDKSENSIIIPLTEDNNVIEKNTIDSEKRVNKKPTVHLESPGLLGIGVILSILAIFSLTQVITLIYSTIDQKSIYDKLVDKLLKKYKNKIEVVTKQPYLKGKKKVNVNDFKELLKVYKRVKTPIKYCVISEHNKCQFYIEENKQVFSYIIKAVDLEKKD